MADLLTFAMVGSALLGLGFGIAIGALLMLWWLSVPHKPPEPPDYDDRFVRFPRRPW